MLIAVAVTWAGEGIAFFSPYPIGFWVTTLAFAAFLLASGYRAAVDRLGRRRVAAATRSGSRRSAPSPAPDAMTVADRAVRGVGPGHRHRAHARRTRSSSTRVTAGTAIALLSGLVGYFVVLRGQVFAGDALSHVAYTGALAALAAGVDLRLGLFAATITVGLGLGLLGGRGIADDVVIGTTFAWILGLGVFFLAFYTTHASTGNGAASVTVLFGSIFGISASNSRTAVLIAVILIAVLLAIARPLLFASLDPPVAAARGVPVRLLGPLFLALVGATAAEASQAIGALLLFGLLAAPPAAAQRAHRPALAGIRAVRRARRGRHVDRPRARLRLPHAARQLHHHDRRHHRIRPRRRPHRSTPPRRTHRSPHRPATGPDRDHRRRRGPTRA